MGAHAVAAAETMTTAAKAVPHTMAATAETMAHAVAAAEAVAPAHAMATAMTAATAAVAMRGLDVCDWSESEAHRSEPSAQKSNA